MKLTQMSLNFETEHEELRILGIDPARTTGYSILDACKTGERLIDWGEMADKPKTDINERICCLITTTQRIIKKRKPCVIAMESGFAGPNRRTGLKLAEIRGVFKCLAFQAGLDVFEFAPKTIRKVVLGNGKAKKQDIRAHITQLFPTDNLDLLSHDISDSIGAALCLARSLEW